MNPKVNIGQCEFVTLSINMLEKFQTKSYSLMKPTKSSALSYCGTYGKYTAKSEHEIIPNLPKTVNLPEESSKTNQKESPDLPPTYEEAMKQ